MSGPFLNHALTVGRDFRRPTDGGTRNPQTNNQRRCKGIFFLFGFSYCTPKIQRLFSHLCTSTMCIVKRVQWQTTIEFETYIGFKERTHATDGFQRHVSVQYAHAVHYYATHIIATKYRPREIKSKSRNRQLKFGMNDTKFFLCFLISLIKINATQNV